MRQLNHCDEKFISVSGIKKKLSVTNLAKKCQMQTLNIVWVTLKDDIRRKDGLLMYQKLKPGNEVFYGVMEGMRIHKLQQLDTTRKKVA